MHELRRLAYTVLHAGFAGATPPDWLRRALADGLGGVLLWNRPAVGPARLTTLTSALRAVNPDVVIAIAEGADATGLECLDGLEGLSGSPWPSNAALGVVDDLDVTRAVADAIGRDLAGAGIAMKYAPVADVNVNPANPVIGIRSFGAGYDRVAEHTAAFVTALQARGVAACAKHFPGHGDTSVDSHQGLPVVGDDAQSLAAGALKPFRSAIAAGVRAVMTAHLALPAIDSVPATLSRRVLTGILRDELGYHGLIITDAIEMAAIEQTYGSAEAAMRAIAAGADAVFIGGWQDPQVAIARLGDALVDAVHIGRLDEARLIEAAERSTRLAAWAADNRCAGPPPTDPGIGLAAARRALRVTGALEPLKLDPYVIELAPEAATHGPQAEWGLIFALTRQWPRTTGDRLTGPPSDVDVLALSAAGRPLVVAVRDAHRHPWVVATLHALLARRPDATVVEMGLPHGEVPPCRCYLTTFGATAVSSLAAAAALAEGLPG